MKDTNIALTPFQLGSVGRILEEAKRCHDVLAQLGARDTRDDETDSNMNKTNLSYAALPTDMRATIGFGKEAVDVGNGGVIDQRLAFGARDGMILAARNELSRLHADLVEIVSNARAMLPM